MSKREDFLSTLNMEGNGKIPFFPRDLTLGMDALNVKTTDVFVPGGYDYKLSASCVMELQKMVGHDAVVGAINSYSLHRFGGETKYPPDGIPYLSKPPFADIEKMKDYSPDDIRDDVLDGIRKSYALVREKMPDLAVVMNVGGPLNTACNLRGIEAMIMDTVMNPDIAKKASDFGADVMMSIIDFIGYDSCDCVFLASASDNPDMFGPEAFEEYSLPNVKRCVDHVHKNGRPIIYHPHGQFSTKERRELLSKCISTGVDGFQFAENNTPEDILMETRSKCSILGGPDAFTTLLIGTDERIARDVMSYVDILKGEDYIMTCSCSLNRGIPIHSVSMVNQTLKKYNEGII